MECFKCELPGTRVLLFDAISDKGIVKICEKCSEEEDIPVIRAPGYKKEQKIDLSKLRKPAKKRSVVYERLSRMSGIDIKEEPVNEILAKQDVSLKDIVEQNLKERIKKEPMPKPHLVDNFHWILMRSRRMRKMTAEQLAMEIEEPELAVKMAEKGVLPEDDRKLIDKLEIKLRVKLVKDEFRIVEKPVERLVQGVDFELEEKRDSISSEIDFKSDRTKRVTISDLKTMRRDREEMLFEDEPMNFREEIVFNEDATEEMPEFVVRQSGTGPEMDMAPNQVGHGEGIPSDEGKEKPKKDYSGRQDLTDKEIDDILFGRG
ncbi:hypothetical protein GOV13_03970 [Candidatus Pacearchaeota archaeon]|nr:hypothetical protein [Candidatus Pacearchaeota archaeon]